MSASVTLVVVASLAFAVLPVVVADVPCSTNADCSPGEWCHYPVGICHSEDPLGVCEEQPDGCAAVWDPVCGCDFQTHSNEACASVFGVNVLYPGECDEMPCGGYLGLPCDAGEYCATEPGQCGTYFGFCFPVPSECPEACEPVCGCDGLDHASPCHGEAAGVSVLHEGACETASDGIVSGVAFEPSGTMSWNAEDGAVSYDVYVDIVAPELPGGDWVCYLDGIAGTSTPIPDDPASGETWLLQVIAGFADGPGSMGMGSGCAPRVPAQACP